MPRHQDFLIATLLVLAMMLAVVHPILPVQALRDRKALLPTADAMMRSYSSDFNEGRAVELWVEGASDVVLSFLMFNLAELPGGSIIEEATLRLYEPTEGAFNMCIVNVHYCPNNDWTEDGITYNNRPAYQPEPIGSLNISSGPKWYEWNITSVATSTYSAADKRLSLALDGYTTHGSFATFDSRQSPDVDKRPELSVLYSYTPSSGVDPAVVGLVAATVVGVVAVAALAYVRRGRRARPDTMHKKPEPKPIKPTNADFGK